ncbi:MAG: hypothetical protein HN612_02810 [Kordiimonadaceae bacterium]|nr:hypothetical protein [Kordiimonadaceae bacterium]
MYIETRKTDTTAPIASARVPTFQLVISKLTRSASILPLPDMQRLSIPYFYRIGEVLTNGVMVQMPEPRSRV